MHLRATKIYAKAKAEPHWRLWGLYVHVCKKETLRAAYEMAKSNEGAPGSDGVTFEAIEERGADGFLEQIRDELNERRYMPLRARKKEIPKEGRSKMRTLSIPCIRDRVVQGALKLIVEPIFEADFQPRSFGYRPKRSAPQAVIRVGDAIAMGKTHVIDLDLKAYFDGVRHDVLLAKVARRISDHDVLHLFKIMLKANGKRGVLQGSVISPVLSNLYLNEVDRMLKRARENTRRGKYTAVEYARFADDVVILIHADPRNSWLLKAVDKRLREELAKLHVQTNEEKSRTVDLARGESFGFLGFDFRRVRSLAGRWRPQYTPKMKKRTALLQTLREVFRRHRSQPVQWVVEHINPILRGWVTYFAIGYSSRCFQFVKRWVEVKVRRARKCPGLGLGPMEYAMAARQTGAVQRLPAASGPADSRLSRLGLINRDAKRTGERSALKPHATFDAAGAGNVIMAAGLRATAKAVEHPPEPAVGAPVLDPTRMAGADTQSCEYPIV